MTYEQYINELKMRANSNDYFDLIKEGVKDNINDELTAMALYYILAEKLTGFGVEEAREEIREHAKQEGTEHYVELVEFAANHNFINEIKPQLTKDIECVAKNNNADIIKCIQDLETTARQKYKALARLAEENKDDETKSFFLEIAEDEAEHFDDLAYINGDTRPLKEGKVLESILKRIERKK